jgi:flavin-dependent dehydrogenase
MMLPHRPTYDADVLIIGGGLAGLTAGIHLAKASLRVLLLEKHPYPQHKVCGEYVSNEVLPYLNYLGISVDSLSPTRIHRFLLSTASGKSLETILPLGGFGISRYAFDHFLARTAQAAGVDIQQADATTVLFDKDAFTVNTSSGQTYTAQAVIGAYGKRSHLDKRLQRPFTQKESPWLGIKAHYRAKFPPDLVALHNFHGGYCGLSQVENGVVNACYLATYDSFKKHRSIDAFQQHVLRRNPFLNDFFAQATPLFEKPLSISQFSFAPKKPIENHILMCGDTAGLIYPLCGNGMAMAIHSAKLASELIIQYVRGELPNRQAMEQQYALAWTKAFKTRLTAGRIVQSIFSTPLLTSVLLTGLQQVPALLPIIIRQTHGKPLFVGES